MPDQVIRILNLEDDAADAELIRATLEAADVSFEIVRVQTREEFIASLGTGKYDIILADYKLPMFDGISAMKLVKDSGFDIPFIFVSGTMGEDAAIEALTHGATDYVLKQKLSRLVPAIKRALHEAENERERKRAEEALEKRLVALTRPLDDSAGIEFEELFNLKDIQHLQDEFAKATGVASIITHPDGTPITEPSNFCRLCKDIIRMTDKGRANCYKSDSVLGRFSAQGPSIQPCMSGGLWDAGAGISIGGHHIANWLIGQVRDETQSEEKMREYARDIGADESYLIEAFREVTAMPQEQFQLVAQALFTLANQLSAIAYQNIQQARFITERKYAEEELRRSEKEKTILNEIANVFLTIPDEEMYRCVLPIVLSVMKSKYGIFGYIGGRGDLIIPSMTKEIWSECQVEEKTMSFPADSWGKSLWGKAIREKRTFFSDGPFCTPGGHLCIEHFLTAPIVYGEETVGLISVANKEGGYTDEDRNMLERITVYISPILNARLQRDKQEMSRMEAETALRESEEKYRLLVANAGEAIFIAQDEVIKFPNPCALEMMGYSAEELAGIPFIDLIHPRDRNMVYEKYMERLKGDKPPETYRFRVMRKSGEEIWVQLTVASISWEGKPGTLCFLRDVTEEKNLEAQLMQAQKMEALGTLASGIAHDFNNILTPIIGFTDMSMSMYGDHKVLLDNLGEVMSASTRAKDLVKQILTYTRQVETEPQPIQLKYLVKETLKLLKAAIPKTIEITLNNQSNAKVMVDPTHLHQVLMNLYMNAIHAMQEKGGILSVGLEDFDVDNTFAALHPGASPGRYVVFSVKDTGHGMTQDIMEKIFEPYFTTKEVGTGTGLGLAVVTGIVQKYSGVITVESAPGKGSTFKVFLPMLEQDSQATVTSEEGLPTGNESILFIDDERTIVKYGKMMLEQLGYKVTTTMSSRNALETFQKYPDQFDLVITDMIMPDMPGDRLAKEMIKIRSDIPIILCSGQVDIVTKDLKEKVGIKAYVSKPIIKGDLADMVRKVLDDAI